MIEYINLEVVFLPYKRYPTPFLKISVCHLRGFVEKLCRRYGMKSFFFKKSQKSSHEYNIEFANLARMKTIL